MATSPADAARLDLLEQALADLADAVDELAGHLTARPVELDPDAAAALAAGLAAFTRAELDTLARSVGLDPEPYGTKAQLAAALVDTDPDAAAEVVQ